jgi:hypothetical protein
MKEEELIKLEKKLWESADKMRGAVPNYRTEDRFI